jgi:hypothetical protein
MVAASSGNTAIAGTLDVTGAATLSSTLGVAGNATVGGTLTVAGLITGRIPLFHVREEQPAGTDGGTFNSGAWRTRTLNTEVTNEISGASLASNQIILPAGAYEIDAAAPAVSCGDHKLKFRNVTDGSDTIIGRSAHNEFTTGLHGSDATVFGRFTIGAQKTFELQHQCSNTRANVGLGNASNFSVAEVYAEVRIKKVA